MDVWPRAPTHVRGACRTALLALGQEGLPPCFPGAVGAPENKFDPRHPGPEPERVPRGGVATRGGGLGLPSP